jgi:hypothetical protein
MGYFVIKNAENKIVDSPGFMDFAALYILQIIITLKSNLLKDNKMFFEEFLKKIENPKKNNIETHLKDYYKKTSQNGILILNTDADFQNKNLGSKFCVSTRLKYMLNTKGSLGTGDTEVLTNFLLTVSWANSKDLKDIFNFTKMDLVNFEKLILVDKGIMREVLGDYRMVVHYMEAYRVSVRMGCQKQPSMGDHDSEYNVCHCAICRKGPVKGGGGSLDLGYFRW